jgi:hypothetical protein
VPPTAVGRCGFSSRAEHFENERDLASRTFESPSSAAPNGKRLNLPVQNSSLNPRQVRRIHLILKILIDRQGI